MTADDNRLVRYQQAGDGIRAELWYLGNPLVEARHRDDWPEMWTQIDRLIALVDEDLPRLTPKTESLFLPPELGRRG